MDVQLICNPPKQQKRRRENVGGVDADRSRISVLLGKTDRNSVSGTAVTSCISGQRLNSGCPVQTRNGPVQFCPLCERREARCRERNRAEAAMMLVTIHGALAEWILTHIYMS